MTSSRETKHVTVFGFFKITFFGRVRKSSRKCCCVSTGDDVIGRRVGVCLLYCEHPPLVLDEVLRSTRNVFLCRSG